MNNLRILRQRIGLTQTELACLAGCTPGAVCHWENGRRKMDVQLCHKLLNIFRNHGHTVSLDELVPPDKTIKIQ